MSSDDFKNVSQILNRILQQYNLKDDLYEKQLISDWEVIVGKQIAKQCKVKFLKNGTLFLESKDKVWKQELDMRRDELLNLVQNKLKSSLVKNIKFL